MFLILYYTASVVSSLNPEIETRDKVKQTKEIKGERKRVKMS